MLNLSDILKLSSLGSSKLFSLLKRNNIKLSKKVLNYSIKQVVITHILTSEDCIELRGDVEKLKNFSLSQLVNYLRVNYVQVRIEDILNNLWTVISKNLDQLHILKTDIEILLNSDDFQFETVESLVKNSSEIFVDANNEVDGLDFLEAKKSYKLYSNIGFLRGELERLNVAVPFRVSRVDYMKRVLYALGGEAEVYQDRVEKMSFDELDDFVKHQGLDVNGCLLEDDLIKLLVNHYASHNEVVTKLDYESIIKLDFDAVNENADYPSVARPTDQGLVNSINDVLNFESHNEDQDEIDDILKELDEDYDEPQKPTKLSYNYPDEILNATIKADGTLETKEEKTVPEVKETQEGEEENYDLTGLFDDDLINSVLNDTDDNEVTENPNEPKLKYNYPDSILNATINADGTLSPAKEVKEEKTADQVKPLIDKDLVTEVIKEETRYQEPSLDDVSDPRIISSQIREQIQGEKGKSLDVKLTNLQSEFKVETKSEEDEAIEEASKQDKKESKKLSKKNKKEKKAKKDKKTKVKVKPKKKSNVLIVLLMIWFIIMIMILLMRVM